jgi:glutathione S-transferase
MMQLIGYMDSPYVRRVAVTAQFLGLAYEHRELSIFRDFEAFRAISPLVKVPTLICDDGQVLLDSSLIIDYFESRAGRGLLMPADEPGYARALGLIGTALVANEKAVQLIYELSNRPTETQFEPWVERLQAQLDGAIGLLEQAVGDGATWLFGDKIGQADITTSIAWRFLQLRFPDRLPAGEYPGLVAFSSRAEALPQFKACPVE